MFPKGPFHLMYRLYRHIFPAVHTELNKWKEQASMIPNPELRKQALDSISNKTFHCEGGSVFASAHLPMMDSLVSLTVAYQTISDYLDNLCDRSTSHHPDNFACLHQSMLDAVTLSSSTCDYYMLNAEKDDGGYLMNLVAACQHEIRKLKHYTKVKEPIHKLASLYCDLQIHKHTKRAEREKRLLSWWESNKSEAPVLHWNEFAAAAGSTLGIFHLFQAASCEELSEERVQMIMESYFPWICALHILLDYLIDLEEDQIGGDLNFITYYQNEREIYNRIHFISQQARIQSRQLPDQPFHEMIIDGLLGLYLSDGKVLRQPMVRKIAKELIGSSSIRTRFFFWNSRGYRGSKAILQAPSASRGE